MVAVSFALFYEEKARDLLTHSFSRVRRCLFHSLRGCRARTDLEPNCGHYDHIAEDEDEDGYNGAALERWCVAITVSLLHGSYSPWFDRDNLLHVRLPSSYLSRRGANCSFCRVLLVLTCLSLLSIRDSVAPLPIRTRVTSGLISCPRCSTTYLP